MTKSGPVIYFTADIEGMSGYKNNLDQAAQDAIQRAHLLATAEGLREGGAGHILMKSFHGSPGAYPDYVTTPLRRIPGELDLPGIAESKAAGLVMAGFHGLPPNCGWGHAYRFSNLVLNGKRIGEITIQVLCAAAAGVPPIFFAGDSHGAGEFRDIAPGADVLVLRPGSLNLDEGPTDPAVIAKLRAGAKRAMSLVGKAPVPKLPGRFRLEAPMASEAVAEVVPKILLYPVTVEGKHVVYETADFYEMYHFFQDMFNLSAAARRYSVPK